MAPLTDHEKAVYEWQIWVPGFGEAGQQALKDASVLVSRVGGLGSVVAYELAAAGIGRLVLAHAGDIKPSDLNRQLLMTHDGLGSSRVESAQRRLKELNTRLEIVAVPENVTEENAAKLVGEVDLVVDCAPLFPERFAMNRQCIQQGKPLVDCAMYDCEFQITTILPGQTPCLACLFPEDPPAWRREFPVFGLCVPGLWHLRCLFCHGHRCRVPDAGVAGSAGIGVWTLLHCLSCGLHSRQLLLQLARRTCGA